MLFLTVVVQVRHPCLVLGGLELGVVGDDGGLLQSVIGEVGGSDVILVSIGRIWNLDNTTIGLPLSRTIKQYLFKIFYILSVKLSVMKFPSMEKGQGIAF